MLINRSMQTVPVDLSAESRGGWDVEVNPTHVVAAPNTSYPISITVNVPLSPTHHYDMERLMAVSEGSMPHTTTARLITIVHHHPFADMGADHWAAGPVQYLVAEGVVSGYADGTFRPNENVTRAQFAKMLVGAMGWDLQAPAAGNFSDVPSDHWAYAFVETAAAYGILSGYADGTFRPYANVTRAQVAKMIVNAQGWYLDIPPDGSSFTDVQPEEWYRDYAEVVNTMEVMSGYSDGSFRPNAPASRAQIAKILVWSIFSDPSDN